MGAYIGKLIISLDLELFWGVRDKRTLADYGNNIKKVHKVIPRMLEFFDRNEIHATWAYVGLLALDKGNTIFPETLPKYVNQKLCPFKYINTLKSPSDMFNEYHSANYLINEIRKTPYQELATHTYSHYYCLESEQSSEAFKCDITKAKLQFSVQKDDFKTIIFPRNQYDEKHLEVCRREGLKYFRGNQAHWAYNPHNEKGNSKSKRLFRLVDSYINLSGSRLANIQKEYGLTNIPASSFYRPYSKSLSRIEFLKLRRIKKAMKQAAKTGGVYHLWWHPHNFGENIEENFEQLGHIIEYYKLLKKQYGFMSYNMSEIGDLYE